METYPFLSFDVNEILFSSSYKKIRDILGKQFGESFILILNQDALNYHIQQKKMH